jgi:hypothetical protein
MSTTQNKRTITKKLPVLKTLEKGKKQELVKVFKAIAKAAKDQVKDAKKQAKIDAKAAEKQAKIDAKAAEKQAKFDAKAAEKQAKIDAKAAEKQAKIDAKAAEKQAKIDAKAAEKQERADAKEAAKQAMLLDRAYANRESKLLRKINRCKKVVVYEASRSFVMNWCEYVSGCIVSDTIMEAARAKHEETKDVV